MSQKSIKYNNTNINEISLNSSHFINQCKLSLFNYCINLSFKHNIQILICFRDHNHSLSILSTKEPAETFIYNTLSFPIYANEIYSPSNIADLLNINDDFVSVSKDNTNTNTNLLTTQSQTYATLTEQEGIQKHMKKHTIRIKFPKESNENKEEDYDLVQGANKKNVMLYKKRNEIKVVAANNKSQNRRNGNKYYLTMKKEDKREEWKEKVNKERNKRDINIKEEWDETVSKQFGNDIYDNLFKFDEESRWEEEIPIKKDEWDEKGMYNKCISSIRGNKYEGYDNENNFDDNNNNNEDNLSLKTQNYDFGFKSFFDI